MLAKAAVGKLWAAVSGQTLSRASAAALAEVATLPATVVLGSSNVITDSPAFGAADAKSDAQSGTGLGVGPTYPF